MNQSRPPAAISATMFLTPFAVLALQIALTRVLSASVNYHGAFVVLAVTMLGLAVSAISAFRDFRTKDPTLLLRKVSRNSLLSALSTVLAITLFGFFTRNTTGSAAWMFIILCGSVLFYIPLYYAGYVVAALLTLYAKNASRLYWLDLSGAAFGCLAVIGLLNIFTAPTVVLCCALLLCLPGALIARGETKSNSNRASFLLLAFVGSATILSYFSPQCFRISSPFQERYAASTLLVEWNHMARVFVHKSVPRSLEYIKGRKKLLGSDLTEEQLLVLLEAGWGMSSKYNDFVPPQYWLVIDAAASTRIVGRKDPKPNHLDFLGWDITAAGHWVKKENLQNVFIVGGGGGRDILTAHLFGAKNIDVVELNPLVVKTVQQTFGEFSDKPYSLPEVDLKIGEARSNLLRSNKKYDLIQMSMIDTFAAVSSGSLSLSEHTLYTAEAFQLFVSRLAKDGIFSISRFYPVNQPAELYRVLALAREALLSFSVEDIPQHIAVLYVRGYLDPPIVTCLIKRSPFTESDRANLKKLAERMNFNLLWPPLNHQADSAEMEMLLKEGPDAVISPLYDYRAPTDNRPFFFHFHKPFRSWVEAVKKGDLRLGSPAIATMMAVTLLILLLAAHLIIKPLKHGKLVTSAKQLRLSEFAATSCYFLGLGLGYIFIEFALIQRFIIFLGHPTYSLTVVLFSLLLSSGLGSGVSSFFPVTRFGFIALLSAAAIIGGCMLMLLVVPELLFAATYWNETSRIVLAAGIVAPLGFFMGMLCPLGIRKLESSGYQEIVPFMWGVNSFFSVLGTVLGNWVAIMAGYSALFSAATVCYCITLISCRRFIPSR